MCFILTIFVPTISILSLLIAILLFALVGGNSLSDKNIKTIAYTNILIFIILMAGYKYSITYGSFFDSVNKLASYNCTYIIYDSNKETTIENKMITWKYYMQQYAQYRQLSPEQKKKIEETVKSMFKISENKDEN